MTPATTKALRATTIIPDHLYVDRDADRQLEAIVEDMGRPGYVLVARQMGKTNLLLRMKRQRDAAGAIALYFDLSVHFSSPGELFRHILDALVDRIDSESLRHSIDHDRQGGGFEPNAEYDRHLRLALSQAKADRVIIILDEVDSLVGRPFSDRILAQIRSMYFARANYPVYEKLTYVLSGVAEPTDLIKDKNISPFNIGEKIYLNDFSLEEVTLLTEKAGLRFSTEVVHEVYAWSSGNPRMTWDILSSLEDQSRRGEELSPAAVELTVQRLYLDSYDRPPIDHIRALAENDQRIRSSLMTLLYGKGDTLDDAARSRLYLAGITNAAATGAPKLKNRVIEKALSETWLAQAEAGMRSLAEQASSQFREGNFQQAIALYEQYVAAEGGLTKLSEVQLIELSNSQYSLSRLEDAAATYEVALSATRSKDLKDTFRYYLASCRLLLGQPTEAIPLLEQVIEHGRDHRLQAKHALSTAYISLSPVEHAEDILRICREVLSEVEGDEELSPQDAAELMSASYMNMAQVLRVTNHRDDARAAIVAATEAIDDRRFPGLAATVIGWVDEPQTRSALLRRAVALIVDGDLKVSASPAAFELRLDSLGQLLNVASSIGEREQFARLLPVAVQATGDTGFQALLTLASPPPGQQQAGSVRTDLLKYALTEPSMVSTASPRNRLDASRLWLEHDSQNSEAFKFFAREIDENPTLLSETDILLLIGRLGRLLRFRLHRLALDLADFVKKHKGYFVRKSPAMYALYLQYEMTLHDELNDLVNAHACAREILTLTSATNLRQVDVPAELVAVMPRLRLAAQTMLQKRHSDPLAGIGRNELVVVQDPSTGATITCKYKKVADQLRSGELTFIAMARGS